MSNPSLERLLTVLVIFKLALWEDTPWVETRSYVSQAELLPTRIVDKPTTADGRDTRPTRPHLVTCLLP